MITILAINYYYQHNLEAIVNSDYYNHFSTEIFASGSTDGATRCVDITIIDDDSLEGDQTFTVTLSTSDPNVVIVTSRINITIIDNDG